MTYDELLTEHAHAYMELWEIENREHEESEHLQAKQKEASFRSVLVARFVTGKEEYPGEKVFLKARYLTSGDSE